jgi:site-specific DNA-methyltransferase (adenine-specific)
MEKREAGRGGIWRLPPSFDGAIRQPLPRFTALNAKERDRLREFFAEWSKLCRRVLVPGAHVFVASNSFLSQLVFEAITEGGLEFRGEVIRLVQTLRGGDRPKNAETEFPSVCSLPRGGYEPWGIFRRPLPEKMTVAECLRTYGTGGLRRLPDGAQFSDVIPSERTPQQEKEVAPHPSLKPLSLLTKLVHASLPLGTGVVADTFMGSGSTVAAAELMGVQCVGVEKSPEFFGLARKAVPALVTLRSDLQLPLL